MRNFYGKLFSGIIVTIENLIIFIIISFLILLPLSLFGLYHLIKFLIRYFGG